MMTQKIEVCTKKIGTASRWRQLMVLEERLAGGDVRSVIVCAKKSAAGRYRLKPLCFARIARPSKAAVVSESEMSEGKRIDR